MNRAFRKRARRLLDSPPRPGQSTLPQQVAAEKLFERAYREALTILVEATPDSPRAVVGRLCQSLHQASGEAWKQGCEFFPEAPARVQCGAGCHWCCHEPILVSPLDAMGAALADLGHPVEYALPTRVRSQLRRIYQPCPLLREGQCSVYDARPVICRAFHSTSVEVCRRKFQDQDSNRESPMELGLYGFTGLPQEGMLQALEEVGLDRQPVILGVAVADLRRDFESLSRDWLEGKPCPSSWKVE